MAIEYIGYREENLRRMAARLGLYFHIDCYDHQGNRRDYGLLTEHSGHDSEIREATEAELQSWHLMVPSDFNPEELSANEWEAQDSLVWRTSVTVNAKDFVAIRMLRDIFEPCTQRDLLLTGLFGWVVNQNRSDWAIANGVPHETPVYVSRAIPVGYFYEGEHQPTIHNRPPSEGERQLQEIPPEVELFVKQNLHPFKRDSSSSAPVVYPKLDPNAVRRDVMERILNVWNKNPELRLGQLLINKAGVIYLLEDHDLVQAVES